MRNWTARIELGLEFIWSESGGRILDIAGVATCDTSG